MVLPGVPDDEATAAPGLLPAGWFNPAYSTAPGRPPADPQVLNLWTAVQLPNAPLKDDNPSITVQSASPMALRPLLHVDTIESTYVSSLLY